jgi:hypothetical protein
VSYSSVGIVGAGKRYYHKGLSWLVIVSSGFDDWIYWHFFTITINYDSLQSVTLYESLHSLLNHERFLFHCDEWRKKNFCSLITFYCSTTDWLLQSRSLLPATSQHGHSWHRAPLGPMPSNGLFRFATGMCLAKYCLADGHIPAVRRHVTILSFISQSPDRLWSPPSLPYSGGRVLFAEE